MSEHSPFLDVDQQRAGDDALITSTPATPFGRRAFIAGATGAVAAGAVAGSAVLPSVAAAADPGFSSFRVVTPTRLVDTRVKFGGPYGFTRLNDKVIRIKVGGAQLKGGDGTVPANASAAVFTLVGINKSDGNNYLAAFPSGSTWNTTANLNMRGRNNVSPNLVTVKLGEGGQVDVLAYAGSEIVLDLVGFYVPIGDEGVEKGVREGRYKLLPVPRRALDTRDSPGIPGPGDIVAVDLTSFTNAGIIEADAQAVAANITAVKATSRGYITAYPFGENNPGTSTLNVQTGENRGIGTMVKLGTDGDGRLGFNVFLERGAHLVIDISGFMTGPEANSSKTGVFVPVDPVRLLDTRRGDGGKKRLWPGWSRAFTLPAAYAGQADAVALNLAAARTMGRGYFTLLAAQTRREVVSNLNVTGAGQTISNHAITQVSNKGVECYSSSGGDVICDVVGWYKATSGPKGFTQGVPAEPPPPAAPTPYWMEIPRLNLGRSVLTGASIPITDSGQVWHWTGTGFVGGGKSISTFAHRTEAGGPVRYLHTMVPGDRINLITNDQRKYVYEYNSRDITSERPNEILASTRRIGGESVSIVACTVGYDSSKSAYPDKWAPTSLKYRIIVRFSLVEWQDIIPTI